MKEYKPMNNRLFIYIISLFIIVAGYRNLNSNENKKNNQQITREMNKFEEQNYIQDHHLIKLGNEYHWCGIKELEEIKPITDALERNCKNDFCKIENYFNYVKNIPYEAGEKNKDKNSIDVIMNGKGDCDEKSYLLASLMLQGRYETILIYTKDHTFAGINIPNYETDQKKSYFEYKNKKYYYAETTNKNAYIGMYNGINPKEFKFAYSINEKKEIPLKQIKAKIYL